MGNDKKKTKQNAFMWAGIALFAAGVVWNRGFLILLAVCIFIFASVAKGKKSLSEITSIQSGDIQSMDENDVQIQSSESTLYKYHHNSENTGCCPICKESAANGYCERCGYRFNR